MSRLILFFQSKVALAIMGAVLFGGGAALLASASFAPNASQAAAAQSQTRTNLSTSENGTTPTATATRTPTAQATSLHGSVTSVNISANLFTVRISGGATRTVVVTSQTLFQGACSTLGGLHTGWHVVVEGAYQDDGTFAATAVTSSFDN
jgi:hypothetical protein